MRSQCPEYGACADRSGVFRLNVMDVHCCRIFFGGSADNGYARLLGGYLEDEAVRKRVTLLEGPAFEKELADIKDRFSVVSFPDVFRNQKLSNLKRRVSFHITPPPTPAIDYATAAAKPPAALSTAPKGSTTTKGPVIILRNKLGHRVDPPLNCTMGEFMELKARKLCNSFHLLDKCRHQESYGNCQHEHGEKLNPRQLVALRAVARQSPCQNGLACDDPDCIAGHRCTRDNCFQATCRFPAQMHGVDTKVVTQKLVPPRV